MEIYITDQNFILSDSNHIEKSIIPNEYKLVDEGFFLFGYAILKNKILKNQEISEEDYNNIKNNNIDVSGIYCCIKAGRKAEINLDPLVQYPIFYSLRKGLIISSNIFLMNKILKIEKVCDQYLFDQIAYNSPLRGLSLIEGVFQIQYNDIYYNNISFGEKDTLPINSEGVKFNLANISKYKEMNYQDLLHLYIGRLKNRAEIIASTNKEVHVQLTGGADSRLAFASLSGFDNVKCYVYGDGKSQNRLIFEDIITHYEVPSVNEMLFVGEPLTSTALIQKGIQDTNALKLNNLNTYMNIKKDSLKGLCKITGYYGANVCGGVGLPPSNTSKNTRTSSISEEKFTYHGYVKKFLESFKDLRSSALMDLFYINNRGKSHYASHSIADNYLCSSYDILYDYINLELVKKCPYSDKEINSNAISIDLISLIDNQLALFPYDDRKIPKFRKFRNVPIINCFTGYHFPEKNIMPLSRDKQSNDSGIEIEYIDDFQYPSPKKPLDIFNDDFFSECTSKLPTLEKNLSNTQTQIIIYYLLAFYMAERNKKHNRERNGDD